MYAAAWALIPVLVLEARRHGHLSSSNNLLQGDWTPSRWLLTCLKQCKVSGATDSGQPWLSPTDCANVWRRLSDDITTPWWLFLRNICVRRTKAKIIRMSSSTIVCSLLANPRLPRTWRKLGITLKGSKNGMCVLRKKERTTGFIKGQLIMHWSRRSASLVVGGKFMLIWAAAWTEGYACKRGVENGAAGGSPYIEDNRAGWERKKKLRTIDKPG